MAPSGPFSPGLSTAEISNQQILKDKLRCNTVSLPKLSWRAEVAQSCLALCDPMDCSPPGSSLHGIFQAWILEWVAISFSRGSFPPRHEYWSGLPFPSPGDLPHPGKNTGVGCHFLLQGIFPTQGSHPGLQHCGQTLYRLSHQGSPVTSRGMP